MTRIEKDVAKRSCREEAVNRFLLLGRNITYFHADLVGCRLGHGRTIVAALCGRYRVHHSGNRWADSVKVEQGL